MSAFLLSKSQGAIRTMSFSRIHILRLSFPLILHTRVWPSEHFTMTKSPPVSLSTLPRNSPCSGLTSSFRFASLSTFLLPKRCHQDALQWESAQPEDRFIALCVTGTPIFEVCGTCLRRNIHNFHFCRKFVAPTTNL